ncbi:hypothetical protein ACSFV3_003038 [Escherichia coli]|jgi:hypothetical protein|uniref:hypothetical protein n=1 Tax=Enterobacteriaceae TaxID=543 RepID=UPI00097E5A15|nr:MULTISPECIES: hypothetical protein [Enterobacteriaceae]EKS6326433.1 hypothetical protein [Enterobacter hormaechei]EFH8065607.1 hypothetical protein [Escherichia coli]EFL7017646.1 hypothetical protein [Escherichia coli]EHP6980611.1 hypothetical protein [Escherichia coli]EJB4351718.1 hypothetical protein [Escherichia coli]
MTKIRNVICGAVLSLVGASTAMADTQCGPYRLTAGNDGFMHINGVKPENQKMTFLKAKEDYQNLKMEWTVATNQPGRWVGLEYIKRNGKAILNAQWLQASMDSPRQYATYDCRKVK